MKKPLQDPSRFWRLGPPAVSALLLLLMALKPNSVGGAGVYLGWILSVPLFGLYLLATSALLWAWAGQDPQSRSQSQNGWRVGDFWVSALLLVFCLKTLTGWPRPLGAMDGFPSGHSTLAFGLAWLVAQMRPRLAPLWFALALAIAWSRVEVQAHFDYQVAVGALLGCALAAATIHARGGVLLPRVLGWRGRSRV